MMPRGRPKVSTHEHRGSPRAGKYNAKGRYIGDQWFASEAEATRYEQLLVLQSSDVIETLEVQPIYPVSIKGHHITNYRADFRYSVLDERGRPCRVIVEDVKGMVTDVYALKKKMVEAQYDFKINEIPASKIAQWYNRVPST
jgi:hypothetical protein